MTFASDAIMLDFRAGEIGADYAQFLLSEDSECSLHGVSEKMPGPAKACPDKARPDYGSTNARRSTLDTHNLRLDRQVVELNVIPFRRQREHPIRMV
jgi:hypothetical protein